MQNPILQYCLNCTDQDRRTFPDFAYGGVEDDPQPRRCSVCSDDGSVTVDVASQGEIFFKAALAAFAVNWVAFLAMVRMTVFAAG